MIPLPRAWLLTSALLVGTVTGLVAAVVATVLVKTPVRPDLVVGLVVAVPSVIGMLLILFSGRRWVTTVGAFILAMAPGWLGALVLVQVVSGG
ncbi:putative holin [Mycobacterium sp. CVI_P3]|uniref:Holin n=1 Tax=Mycobacterium pinniadriaticum TaxID=2994102 RepID=A0ABT3SJL3_9MYCO|nr:putative holin [Mycobacterium pinniadriaticum]MCX2933283.1 putative holin [Mycobacterium pinniadriaticum]MCX2939705.1 putative holin [Mycobacterium pinniadriaticum]